MISHFILYVADQDRSTEFYRTALGLNPSLHVPGMTEFELGKDSVLGLMPSKGIKRLLGDAIKDPELACGVPRAELYLRLSDPETAMDRALKAGARLLSPVEPRNWGSRAGYVADPDGHVLAFSD